MQPMDREPRLHLARLAPRPLVPGCAWAHLHHCIPLIPQCCQAMVGRRHRTGRELMQERRDALSPHRDRAPVPLAWRAAELSQLQSKGRKWKRLHQDRCLV